MPSGGAVPEFIQLKKGTEGYKTDLNNFAPSASIAWRPDVQSGFLRALLGDPNQATVRAGYSEAYERQGLTVFTGLYGGNRGGTISLTRNANTGLVRPGESWPVLLSQTSRLIPAAVQPGSDLPDRRRREPGRQPQRLRAGHQDRPRAQLDGRLRAFASRRTWRSRSATSATSGDNQWSAINYNGIRTENLVANGFMNEFKLAMANLAANNASGVSNRVGSFAYFGSGTGTSPLPIYLAYLNGSRDAGKPGGLRQRGQHLGEFGDRRSGWSPPNPNPTASAGDLDGNLTRRNQRSGARVSRELLRPQPRLSPTTTSPTAARSATTTRCSSSCGAGCRAACRPTSTTSTRSRRAGRRSTASASAAR